jgi:hypothetical protein
MGVTRNWDDHSIADWTNPLGNAGPPHHVAGLSDAGCDCRDRRPRDPWPLHPSGWAEDASHKPEDPVCDGRNEWHLGIPAKEPETSTIALRQRKR